MTHKLSLCYITLTVAVTVATTTETKIAYLTSLTNARVHFEKAHLPPSFDSPDSRVDSYLRTAYEAMKAATRPGPPQSAHSHSHSHPHPHPHSHSHSHPHSHRTKTSISTTPIAHAPRTALSVGSAMPPTMSSLRTPAIKEPANPSSPNYFGLAVNPASDPRDSGIGPRDYWSPPTSSIRSLNTSTPKNVPVDANPDFEAFRRQTEVNQPFNLSHGNLSHFSSMSGLASLANISRDSSSSKMVELGGDGACPFNGPSSSREYFASQMSLDCTGSKQLSPTINLPQAQDDTPSFFDAPRQESPMNMQPVHALPPSGRSLFSKLDERHLRLSLPRDRTNHPSSHLKAENAHHRAETLLTTLQDGPAMISVTQLKEIINSFTYSDYLLLDLRVAPQFAQSRINDALNLCIPTTLLKRLSFNLEKLTDTFKVNTEKDRFSKWRDCKYIIVYDGHSSEKKDAVSAMNTIKKFTNEGWSGNACILRGGFAEFSRTYPELIDRRSANDIQSSRTNLSLGSLGGNVTAVAGGCEMPSSRTGANPFFSNIRQNMDLVGGVGQMELKRPDDVNDRDVEILPTWLRKAAASEDHGKTVSDKFLRLEQEELSRMQRALSSQVSYGTPASDGEKNVQIAGFEKGGKNRYNNIWPFEHARVRLQGRPEGACDYVNASHIKALWSNKRYIASQGPLPATFEDFWSVIWDQDVRVIVMLTAESEGGQLKCHPYWAAQEYGQFKVKALSEKKVSLDPRKHRRSSNRTDQSGRRRANTVIEQPPALTPNDHPFVVVRKVALSHSTEPFAPMREITQLHYSSWPDFGAPAQPSHLLSLVELSNSLQRGSLPPAVTSRARSEDPEPYQNSRPLLVHCSAGCGRTGTFCTVDSVIDMLKRQRKELRSGVTPMEISSTERADGYVGKNDQTSPNNNDWIFDQSIDLVEKTVEDFRKQRISMVQSLRQYVLCYETVLEWVTRQEHASRRERSGSESLADDRRSL